MDDLLTEKIKVCWHEIGHYVAARYNQDYFGGMSTIEISLEKKEAFHGPKYEGNHTVKNIQGYDPYNHPPSRIALLAYGCMFQSKQDNKRFPYCFNKDNVHASGRIDYLEMEKVFLRSALPQAEWNTVNDCITAHYGAIKNNPELEDLFSINISDLVQSEEEHFSVDLTDVANRVELFLPVHLPHYLQLVAQLENIFRPHMPN